MGKTKYVLLGIVGVILLLGIIGGIWVYSNFFKASPLATLIIDQGTAQYNAGDGWKDAKSGMELKQDYSVKTLSGSMAKIIFLDSVMRLDENTEVKLDTLSPQKVSITQALGRTWSRLLKLSGISDYEVNTPEAIASVRGTGFAVSYDGKNTEIKVADGTVSVDSMENGVKKGSIKVEGNKQLKIEQGKSDNLVLEDLQEDDWMLKMKNLDNQQKNAIKSGILKKYGFLINTAKSKYGISDEEIDQILTDWIDGKISVKAAIANGDIPAEAAKLIPAEFKRY